MDSNSENLIDEKAAIRKATAIIAQELDLKGIDFELFLEFPREESIRYFKALGLNDSQAEEQAQIVLKKIYLKSFEFSKNNLQTQSKARQIFQLFFSTIIGIICELYFSWTLLFILCLIYSIIKSFNLFYILSKSGQTKNAIQITITQFILSFLISVGFASLAKFMTYLSLKNTVSMILVIFLYGVGVLGLAVRQVLKS